MNKYDYGYSLMPGTTTQWAFDKIKSGSVVLELGPAIGNLAKHLKEEKNCSVDIIEIDDEAGKMAMRFARNSFIGSEKGNLEGDSWYNELKNQRYDYIVVLDVLEHLSNAERLLKRISGLLKENGELIISLPNIAHNSVILNLINNKFVYTKDGLLDDTHVKFYTYSSFCQMLGRCELRAVEKQAIQIAVGMNEIDAVYENVPRDIERFLRTRPMADVYQFLFVVRKQTTLLEEAKFHPISLDATKYKFQVYIENEELPIIEEFLNPEHIDYIINLSPEQKSCLLRIDPVEYKCIVKLMLLAGEYNEQTIPLTIKSSNGFELAKNVLCFFQNDPNIYVELPDEITKVHLVCECLEVNSDDMSNFALIEEKERKLESEKEMLESEKEMLEGEKESLERQKSSLKEQVVELQAAKQSLDMINNNLEMELNYFKNLWFNKAFICLKNTAVKMVNKIK